MQKTNHSLLLINGPNLNLLGMREPETYGNDTLVSIESRLTDLSLRNNYSILCMQSNREYEIIEAIHQAKQDGVRAIIINPGAFTHTSIAIRDAFLGTDIPFVEIHISNIYQREPFRHHSYLSDIAAGVIIGCGTFGYELALMKAIDLIKE